MAVERADGTWYLLVDEVLPFTEDLIATLSHRRIGWCATEKGFPLWVRADGKLVPTRGVREHSDAGIEEAIDSGFCWSPEDVDGDEVAAADLPSWMVDWSIDPPAPETA